jgi:hypothetical protein
MTVHEEHAHAHGGARSEEDRISTPRILTVGVGSLVVFLLSSWIVVAYFRHEMSVASPPPIPKEIGRSKLGMVEQQLFESARRGARDREVRLERLRSFGWVDHGQGVAHIPIDEAMDLVAKGVRAKPGADQQDRERRIGAQP